MLTVTKTSDDDQLQAFVLPSGTSGNVVVRVTDTDQTATHRIRDSLFVDQMFIRSEFGLSDSSAFAATLVSDGNTWHVRASVFAGAVLTDQLPGSLYRAVDSIDHSVLLMATESSVDRPAGLLENDSTYWHGEVDRLMEMLGQASSVGDSLAGHLSESNLVALDHDS